MINNNSYLLAMKAMQSLYDMDTWQNEIEKFPNDTAAAVVLRDKAWSDLRNVLQEMLNTFPKTV